MARINARLMTSDKPLDKKVLIRLLKYVLSKYKWHILIILLCIIISSLASIASSLFTKTLIDKFITPLLDAENPNYYPLIKALSFMACIYLTGIIANFTYQKILVYVTQGTMKNIRDDLFEHMDSLPIKYFDTHQHGDIMSIYTNDTDTLRQVISQSIPQFISSLFTVIIVFGSMLTLSIPLTLVSLLMIYVMKKATTYIAKKSSKYFISQQEILGKENGYIEEMMEGAKVIKVFTHEEKVINDFNVINEQLRISSYAANKYANALGPITNNLGNISFVICSICGGFLAIYGFWGFTIGSLASFLSLNKSFNQPIQQITQQLNSVIMAMAGAQRIFSLIDEESETNEGTVTLVNVTQEEEKLTETSKETNLWAWKLNNKSENNLIKLNGDVKFNNVTFGYDDTLVLHDINLYAKPGQKIAFVGATGAGKTTITNLINRFYDIQRGNITYDGIDIKLINKKDLRKSLGIVLQDTHLFTGTIFDNIRYANCNATEDEVKQAAKLANADSFINHLENGYNTYITNDGSGLSQGQRQLLSIARAALANPPVLILDEATSSIDSLTEKLVQDGMDKLMQGRTTFVIAHRLSTIENSDVIMVLDHGHIIERGPHKDLLENKKIYYSLYTGDLEID